MSWIWSMIPLPVRPWLILAIFPAAALAIYKIDQRGYNRCEAIHANAAGKQKDEARVEIIDSGKKYEEIKKTVARQAGPNDPVGPRVRSAIDSMPKGAGRR